MKNSYVQPMCMYWLFYKTIEQPCAVVRIEVHREYLKQTGVFKCPFAHASKSMNSKSLGMPTVQIVQTFCKVKVQSQTTKWWKHCCYWWSVVFLVQKHMQIYSRYMKLHLTCRHKYDTNRPVPHLTTCKISQPYGLAQIQVVFLQICLWQAAVRSEVS